MARSFDDIFTMVHNTVNWNRCNNSAAEIAAAAEIYKMEMALDKLTPLINSFANVDNESVESENFEEDIYDEDFSVQLDEE